MKPTITSLCLIVLTLFAATPARAADFWILDPIALHWQAKTKAQVVGYRLGSERVFDGIAIFNGSRSTLTQVQIGCIVEAVMPDGTTRFVTNLVADPHDANVGPYAVGTVSNVPWNHDQIIAVLIAMLLPYMEQQNITLTLGVVSARWEDGTRFRRNIANGFQTRPSARLDRLYGNISEEQIIATIMGSPEFFTGTSPVNTITTTCQSADGWICITSGQCVGSARAPVPNPGGSKCVTFVAP